MASSLFYPRTGGVERYVFEVSKGLADWHGHEVTVVTTGSTPRRTTRERLGPVDVVRLPTWGRLAAAPLSPTWTWQLRRLVHELRPEVINTHAPQPGLPDLLALTSPRHLPQIATYHSGSLKKGTWTDRVIGPYETSVLPRVLAKARVVVVTGRAVADEGFIPETARYIPPGVDPELFRAGPQAGRRPGELLYVGRIARDSAWKGISTLLQALCILKDDHPDVRLRMVGDGNAVDDYRRQAAALGLTEHVEFAGRLDGADLAAAYRSASLLVLSSETAAESFGMVLIEALACGTPVVGTRIGGIPGVIEDTGGGVTAPPRDPQGLAAAIGNLLKDPAAASALGHRGQEAVTQRYTWRRTVEAYDAVIGSLLGQVAA